MKSSMRVGIINNLRAGKCDSRVEHVLDFLSTQPDVLHLETDSDQMVPEALARFEEEEVDVLILNGGDGTVQMALTHLLGGAHAEWRPLVAPIRGGW